MKLIMGDCLEELRALPDKSVNLVLTDPPYNIGVTNVRGGEKVKHEWDVIEDYENWCIKWLKECSRVLTDNGVLYFWHNDIEQLSGLLPKIKVETDLMLRSFCIWDKGQSFMAQAWKNISPDNKNALRSWFNVCEYCLHLFKEGGTKTEHDKTGMQRILSNPACFAPLKSWYEGEKKRLELTNKDIGAKYTEATGKRPYMLRHYFCDSQFEIPTETVWDTVYRPLGFNKTYEELRQEYEELRQEYEELRQEYEELRQEYEELRNYHKIDPEHCNVWRMATEPTGNRLHPCQKPVELFRRLVRVSCPPGGVVLDPFMGSGTTGVACIKEGREFIGIERDPGYFIVASDRLEREREMSRQITLEGF